MFPYIYVYFSIYFHTLDNFIYDLYYLYYTMNRKEYKIKMRKLMLEEQILKNRQLQRQNSLLTTDYIEYRKNRNIQDVMEKAK